MLKRFKVLVLSLSIVILGSSVAGASPYRYVYRGFRNYNINSNFYDTYTRRNYTYNWAVSIWTRPWLQRTQPTPVVPVIPTPELPSIPEQEKPEVPSIPEQEKPEVPSIPEEDKPEVPSTPEEDKPEVPSTPEQDKPEVPSTPEQEKPEVPSTPEEDKPEVPSTPPIADSSLTQMESEVVRLVNIERQKNGLAPFTSSNKLSDVAREKSRDMAINNYFSHQSPKYGSPFDMIKSFGISYRTAGENIAKGYNSPESVVRGWMNSQGHRENILNASFNTIGVGSFTSSNGTIYWTQMFTN